jgi:transcription elongation factor GreA
VWCSDERGHWRLVTLLASFRSSSALVASPFRIYNVCLSGVWGARSVLSRLRRLFQGVQPSAELGVRGKQITMSDPLAKIKRKLQEEIDQLSYELNVELPKEIAVARAHGDLSENAEYKFAKERQTYVNAKIAQLKKRMGDLGMLNLNNIPKDRSGYGSRVVVLDVARDVKVAYKLVSSEEADAEKGLISTTSPIGRALLNRRVGDEIEVATPAGKKEFEIVELVTIHEGE